MDNEFFEYAIKPIIITLFLGIIGFALIYGCVWCIYQTPYMKQREIACKEWREKVNNCVLNENYRHDCRLIIYRDKQIQNERQQSRVNQAAISGSMVGAMIGSSMR